MIIVTQKKIFKKIITPIHLLNMNPQIALNKLYLNIAFEGDKDAKKNILGKLSSYGTQDKKKKRYNPEKIIIYDTLLEKMVESKMKCCYCCQSLRLFYAAMRDPSQWTLDRINNMEGHNTDNVVIACLKCNLERRRRDDKKFLFAKQMKIIKIS